MSSRVVCLTTIDFSRPRATLASSGQSRRNTSKEVIEGAHTIESVIDADVASDSISLSARAERQCATASST